MDYQTKELTKLKISNGVVNEDEVKQSHPNNSETEGGQERRNNLPKSPSQSILRSSVMPEPSAALLDQVGHRFNEVFQLKQGLYADLPSAKISEMMKSSSLDNAPTQSLLSVVNGILDESIEKRNGEIPHRVACLLRKVVQEVERRISTQAEHLRTQNSLIKAHEKKYQSRIKLLETLASVPKETEPLKSRVEVTKNGGDEDVKRLVKEKEEKDKENSKLKQELQTRSDDLKSLIEKKEELELEMLKLKQELENIKSKDEKRLIEEKEERDREISTLKQELKNTKGEDVKRLIEEKEEKDKEILTLKLELQNTKGEDMKKLIEEKEGKDREISTLKQELRNTKGDDVKRLIEEKEEKDKEILTLKLELQNTKGEDMKKLIEEKVGKDPEISTLKQELQNTKTEDIKRLIEEKEEKDKEILTLKRELQNTKGEDMKRLIEEKEGKDREISTLIQELQHTKGEVLKKLIEEKEAKDREISSLKQELQKTKDEDMKKLIEETEVKDREISTLKQELQNTKGEVVMKLIEEKEAKDREISTLKQELQHTKGEVMKKMIEEKEGKDQEISTLKQELQHTKGEVMNKLIEEKEGKDREISTLIQELQHTKGEVMKKLIEERDGKDQEISTLKEEIHNIKSDYESRYLQLETKSKSAQAEFEERKQEFDNLLEDSRNKAKKIQEYSALKRNQLMDSQFAFGQKVRYVCESIKLEILKCGKSNKEDIQQLGVVFKSQAQAVANYHEVLAENRKMFNDIQELRGNIRVYCRVRPFHPGQKERKSTMEHIGEHGELVLANSNKPGKEGLRSFRFNKVYGPTSTQVEVYKDVQPLVRSVLDGYNVCIFAYGQTGSGKTYTMSGPDGATEENWGVNFRALNDLFGISKKRAESTSYDIGVQVVEIYNEQVRDLLASGGSQKKLGILSRSNPEGLAVPDASMFPVESTADVMELMDVGFKNRAVSSTAMNERSSRSHSVVSIHIRGRDLKTGSSLHGNLHLVDLAGSERVDRSEVTGDRLKEAQHINKSLSALGDVIFALAQKSQHVPYRNSKLTQLLQTSLGGQAKTLMFVQLNPDVSSYSETLSTLKFAERVSGVELGAAKSTKENSNSKELMEQIASLKDIIAKRDEEIEKLHYGKNVTSPTSPSIDNTEDEDRLSDMASENGNSMGTESDIEVSKSADRSLERQNSVSKIVRSIQKQTDRPSPSMKKTPSSLSSGKSKKGWN